MKSNAASYRVEYIINDDYDYCYALAHNAQEAVNIVRHENPKITEIVEVAKLVNNWRQVGE